MCMYHTHVQDAGRRTSLDVTLRKAVTSSEAWRLLAGLDWLASEGNP